MDFDFYAVKVTCDDAFYGANTAGMFQTLENAETLAATLRDEHENAYVEGGKWGQQAHEWIRIEK